MDGEGAGLEAGCYRSPVCADPPLGRVFHLDHPVTVGHNLRVVLLGGRCGHHRCKHTRAGLLCHLLRMLHFTSYLYKCSFIYPLSMSAMKYSHDTDADSLYSAGEVHRLVNTRPRVGVEADLPVMWSRSGIRFE